VIQGGVVDVLASLSRLSDTELVARVKDLAARQRAATADLVAHLAELETRQLHLRAGYGSLFVYCRDALCLSEHEAYHRIAAARAARRFTRVPEMLREGSVNLTTVRLLAPLLTPDNHRDVLESARGKTKPQVEEIVARLMPRPDVPPLVRRLPSPRPAPPPPASVEPAAPVEPALPYRPPPPPRPTVTPLAPYRYKVQFTIGDDTLEKLRLAKDMLRHAIPSGDDAAVFERALDALLADLARKKYAAADQPRPPRGTSPGSRHVPAEVRRAVWLRDLGRCAFVGEGPSGKGRRCTERAFLEFHHVRPYAAGGEATVENIQLRCRRHNDYEAKVYFGRAGRDGGGGWVRDEGGPYGVRP
jgi:HNH endonuclease